MRFATCSIRSSRRSHKAPGWAFRFPSPSCRSTAARSRSRAARDTAPRCCSTSPWRNGMARGETPTQTQGARTILIVDDERTLRFSLGEWARDAGFFPLEAASESEALERLRDHEVDVVVLDLKLADEDGMQVLRRLREVDPVLPVVMLTGHGTVEHAVRATRLGAYDFVLKPPDLEHLEVVLRRAMEHAHLRREVDHLRAGAAVSATLLGESAGLKQVIRTLD